MADFSAEILSCVAYVVDLKCKQSKANNAKQVITSSIVQCQII